MSDPDSRPQAYWCGDELEVTFSGTATPIAGILQAGNIPTFTDFGVPGSPTWNQIGNIQIEDVYVLGVYVKPENLPQELLDKLHELSHDCDW